MPPENFTLRLMHQEDGDAVARLVFELTNHYYAARLGAGPIVTAGRSSLSGRSRRNARMEEAALALIAAELHQHRGGQPVLLAPVECRHMVSTLYGWGARNCEIHLAEARGAFDGFHCISMPTFMPETG